MFSNGAPEATWLRYAVVATWLISAGVSTTDGAAAFLALSAPAQTPALAPSSELRALTAALEGAWRTSEVYAAFGPTPTGGRGLGDIVWRPGPGGHTLIEEYRTKMPAGELLGFGVIWWDQTRNLQHLWCININPGGCEMFPPPPRPGPQWNGQSLVIDTEVAIAGVKYAFHEVISDITPTSYRQTIDLGDGTGTLRRWLTSNVTRVAPKN